MARVGEDAGLTERLRRIEAVTDTALAQLDVPDLLEELLIRVRELLQADTAAVLMLDPAAQELVATAASGIEEEVRQGVRIPIGAGFAGRIAAQAAPVVIDDVDHAIIRNKILRERGIKSLLGVPLVVEGRVIGVIHVGTLRPRRFDPDDIELLQVVADRVALAVDARRSSVDRAAAAALQRSLVPGRPPAIPGLETAARHLPGDEGGVGGDWYDLFPLPTGHVGVVMGDVVGRGLGAAVVMGRLRSALRAYALETTDPLEVLTRLDRKVQHFEAGHFTTVLYGVIDPWFETLTISSAGHLLPIVACPGEEPYWLQGPIDPPLGATFGARTSSIVVALRAGAMLACFTDGLVERPGEPLDAGISRLVASLELDSAEASCTAAVASLVGGQDRRDDVALLVLRHGGDPGAPMRIELPAAPASLAQARHALRRWMRWAGVGDDDGHRILLAAGEATSNALEHAFGATRGTITIEIAGDGGTVTVTVADSGQWREEPRGDNRGRGRLIMERTSEGVEIDRSPSGTTVRLRFEVARG